MNFFYILLRIVGALGIFLYGLRLTSDSIQMASGDKLKRLLNHITNNSFVGIFTGFAVTALIQSSSATTVMVVSFVNAGLLTLRQSLGVIMGANIGTTITGWLVSILGFKLSISSIALPIIGIGFPFAFSAKNNLKHLGTFLVGFGMLFIGLDFLKDAVPAITSDDIAFLTDYSSNNIFSRLLFVLVGVIITLILHSSSASMAIILTMASAGMFDLYSAAAMILGSNIGTTVDALLASIGARVVARQAALGHLLFNVFGTMIVFFLFPTLLTLAKYVTFNSNITSTLAAFHTLFNIFVTLALVWFIPKLALLITRLIKDKKETTDDNEYRIDYLHVSIQNLPEGNRLEAAKETSKMAVMVDNMLETWLDLFSNPDKKMGAEVEELREKEDFVDQMKEKLTQFLVLLLKEPMNDSMRQQITSLIRIVSELERIGDSCYNLMLLAERRYQKGFDLHKTAIDEITPYANLSLDFIRYIQTHLDEGMTNKGLERAIDLENKINDSRNKLRKKIQNYIAEGEDVRGELLFMDMVHHIEHIGDYCFNIANAINRRDR